MSPHTIRQVTFMFSFSQSLCHYAQLSISTSGHLCLMRRHSNVLSICLHKTCCAANTLQSCFHGPCWSLLSAISRLQLTSSFAMHTQQQQRCLPSDTCLYCNPYIGSSRSLIVLVHKVSLLHRAMAASGGAKQCLCAFASSRCCCVATACDMLECIPASSRG